MIKIKIIITTGKDKSLIFKIFFLMNDNESFNYDIENPSTISLLSHFLHFLHFEHIDLFF